MEKFHVEKVNTAAQYEGLRDLWVRVFGDEPEFVDGMYECFDGNICGYVICSDDRVVSALTLYKCGCMYVPAGYDEWQEEDETCEAHLLEDLAGRPVYVTYAVCTDPEYRGRGLASALTGHVRREVAEQGGISLVSPAEPSLIEFYRDLGYKEGFTACEGVGFPEMLTFDPEADYDEDDDGMLWGLGEDGEPGFIDDEEFEAFDPGLTVVSTDAAMYNRFREAFLSDTVHVSLSNEMMEAVRMNSLNGDGLLVINGGDAVAVIDSSGRTALELLVNPVLMEISQEIDMEIAARLASYYGLERLTYRTPGYGVSQSMYTADDGTEIEGYFGFPLE